MKDHARQALQFFLNSLIFYVLHGLKTELIISRLEQDEYYSSMKEIILHFADTHHSIDATILLRFVPKILFAIILFHTILNINISVNF